MDNEESEAYYSDLRAWKATAQNYGRPVSFGWFSNWSPEGPIRKGYLTSLPDSIDMVSMWSGPFDLNEAKIADKNTFQQKKGGKIFVCYILHNIGTGITPASVAEKVQEENPDASSDEITALTKKATEEYWGFTSGVKGSEDHTAAIRRYAKALVDTIVATNYDGLDIDWEYPNINSGSTPIANGEYAKIYAKYYRVSTLQNWCGEYYDYRKHIFTENFESSWNTGGVLLRQAAYNHQNGPKGGVGAFRLDNDYDNTPDYKYMRQAIQINQQAYEEWIEEHSGNNNDNTEQ